MRDTPPDVQDGPFGSEPDQVSNFFVGTDEEDGELTPDDAKKIGNAAYRASTDWLGSGRRDRWSDSLKAFNGQHPSGSKYLSREYSGRSRLYRPQTRTMVRKGESSTAMAFFSNEDVVNIKADNDDDAMQLASAEVLKALIQYRLTKTIPWFLTLVGARQDAEVMGIAVAKCHWIYEERSIGVKRQPRLDPTHGMPTIGDDGHAEVEEIEHFEIVKDEPAIDLISPENIRYSPGADWRDPVHTSPYIIELIPMYAQDVLAKMDSGEWNQLSPSAITLATLADSTRNAREDGRRPGSDADEPAPFDTVWIRANIIKYGGQDWHFLSLSNGGELLTDPVPLKEVHLHGERPYVVGMVVLETHKNYPASKVELVRDLQRIANEDINLRFDAVKMALNPRQFVAAGAGVELNDLRTMVPGKVVVVKSPKGEPPSSVISWDRPPEPGMSAYQEQQLNQLDFDALTGSFTNASVQASQFSQQSATGMHLMSGEASGITEYELRLFSETWVEPVLRLLIKLEQAYETDDVVLGVAASKAQLFQRFGHDKVTDDLLNGSVTTSVNVGIGATNPAMKLRAFQQAAQIIETIMGNPIAAQGLDFHAVLKEIMAGAGYRDGERFIKPGFDPATAMQQMEQAKAQAKAKPTGQPGQADSRIQMAQIAAQAQIQEAQIRANIEQQKLDQEMARTREQQENENWRVKYKADEAAWEAGIPQHTQAIQQGAQDLKQTFADHLGGIIPAMTRLDATVKAGRDNLMQHDAALNQHNATLMQLAASHQALAQSHANLLQQVEASHANTTQHLSNLAAHITAPKRIVRGPDGKVAGVETVLPPSAKF